MPTNDDDPLFQITWHLYADVITRFNLLVDECNHLQQTVHNHLASTDQSVFGLADSSAEDATQRPWVPNPSGIRDRTYYFNRPQKRALRNLYVTAGALAKALEDNTATLREAYDRALMSFAKRGGGTESDALYWFLALRGHMVTRSLAYYLTHLQHAQEKLIQILENSPGSLPGPTLLRRWSSGAVGEFLSEYSRQVNGQIQQLLWKSSIGGSSEEFDKWRESQFLIHTWSHRPTSRTTRNRVAYSTHEPPEGSQKSISFTTIWSSYFYLEQPILFPLIYHECAHHYAHSATTFRKSNETKKDANHSRWFNSANEAATLLARVAPLEGGSEQFWADFVGELWSDAISIALCGQGYLVPLMLQIIALETSGDAPTFQDFDIESDEKTLLNQLGKPSQRTLSICYPCASLGYLWTARALFAIRAFEALFDRTSQIRDWLIPLKAVIAGWRASGAVAMSERLASNEHATFWAYSHALNDWIVEVAWDCLKEFVYSLRSEAHNTLANNEYRIPKELTNRLSEDVRSYTKHFLNLEPRDAPLPDSNQYRLEDLCPAVRKHVGALICKEIRLALSKGMQADAKSITRWTNPYVDYIECDGSVAFRLATEWLAIRRDIIATAARIAMEGDRRFRRDSPVEEVDSRPKPVLTDAEWAFLEEICNAVSIDRGRLLGPRADHGLNLAKQGLPPDTEQWRCLRNQIDVALEKYLTVLETFEGEHDNVGTLTLGVVRPYQSFRENGFGNAIRATERYFKVIDEFRSERLRKSQFGTKVPSLEFLPLFGEYNFAIYQPGLASINKMFRPAMQPAMLQKPRTALRLLKRSKSSETDATMVRVAQISFKYRWQWLFLAESLGAEADLYLSSGWEDLILVTAHETPKSFRNEYTEKQLRPRSWLDVHSSVGLPKTPELANDGAVHSFDKSQSDYVARWSKYGFDNVVERTGRYDLTIDWTTSSPTITLDLWKRFTSIPADEWKLIEGLVTSFGMPADPERSSIQIVSQVMLKH